MLIIGKGVTSEKLSTKNTTIGIPEPVEGESRAFINLKVSVVTLNNMILKLA